MVRRFARLNGPSRALALAAALSAWLLVIVALSAWLSSSQSAARQQITSRLESRAQLGASFTSLYVADVLKREEQAAATWLAGPHPNTRQFERVCASLGVSAAVMLDRHGDLLAVLPHKPALLGHDIASHYAHLAGAVAGRPSVSQVVASAARGLPVVGFAVPFESAAGRRVFSGAWNVASSPLGIYIRHLVTTPGHQVFLVDANGDLVTSTIASRHPVSLSSRDPRLAASLRSSPGGSYVDAGQPVQYASVAIPGLGWHLVVSIPQATLFATIDGPSKWIAWAVLIGFALVGLMVILLIARLRQRGAALATLNLRLDEMAHTDTLTRLPNRRATDLVLEREMSGARRHGHDLSVLLVDLDHFKNINDSFGHHVGDQALRHAAEALSKTMRSEDVVGRWGGEEFVAILPYTDATEASALAERVRLQVAAEIPGLPCRLTATIGVAQWDGDSASLLLKRADDALYAGKASGRDTVVVANLLAAGSSADLN